ncbi:MAG: hypothetical protein NTW50_00435 [Candidatus Berkelbacteria bacterium]|nr:hypothetical protein [Candidatus Berkelbacteria bacterium]
MVSDSVPSESMISDSAPSASMVSDMPNTGRAHTDWPEHSKHGLADGGGNHDNHVPSKVDQARQLQSGTQRVLAKDNYHGPTGGNFNVGPKGSPTNEDLTHPKGPAGSPAVV